MRNEESAEEEDQRDPGREEEGDGGRDANVMRQGDDTTERQLKTGDTH